MIRINKLQFKSLMASKYFALANWIKITIFNDLNSFQWDQNLVAVQIRLHLYKASRRNPRPRISCPAVWSTASQLKVLIHCQTSLEESITVLEESITVVNHPGSRGIMPGQLPARISAIMFEIPSHLQDRYEPKKRLQIHRHTPQK